LLGAKGTAQNPVRDRIGPTDVMRTFRRANNELTWIRLVLAARPSFSLGAWKLLGDKLGGSGVED